MALVKCGYMALSVCSNDEIIVLEWLESDDENYETGWYWFEDDGPPGFFGKTAKEAADEARIFFKVTSRQGGSYPV